MKIRHEKEMKEIREEMQERLSEVISMIQQNPVLSFVKPQTLTKKLTEKSFQA